MGKRRVRPEYVACEVLVGWGFEHRCAPIRGEALPHATSRVCVPLADREGGLAFDAGNLTLGEYLVRWLSDSVKSTVRASTYERHEQLVRSHIRPALGEIKLKALTPAHVRRLISEKSSGTLAAGTVRKIHSTLHKVLSQAVSDGLIPRNAAAVQAPSPAPKEIAATLGGPRPGRSSRPPGSPATASRPSMCWRSPPD